MGIWLTKYHSDSLSLRCASPLWSVPRCSPRPAKGTGARLQEADAMNNPWVWGPSDNDWLKGNIPEHTGYHMDPYGFRPLIKSGFPVDMKPILGKQTCDALRCFKPKACENNKILKFGGCQLCSSSARCSVQSIHRFFARRWGSNFQVLDRGPGANWLWSIWWYTLGWVGWYRLMEIGEWFGPSKHPDFHACPEWFGPNSWIYIYIIIYQEFSREFSIYFPDISSGCMFLLGRKRRLKPPTFWGTRSPEAGCTATSKVTVFNTTTEEVERCRCSLTRLTRLTRFCLTV